MPTPEQKLRDLAQQGLALNTAFRTARDAVAATSDRRAKWATYNLLHVDFDRECHAVLKEMKDTPERGSEERAFPIGGDGSENELLPTREDMLM